MTKLKIKVTKEILELSKFCGVESKREIGANCAVALAVRDIFPWAWVFDNSIVVYRNQAEVESMTIGFMPNVQGIIFLPKKVSEYILEFDKTSPLNRPFMDEIEFEVEIPDNVLWMINIDEVKETLKASATLELKEV